jgi:phenylacetate-coenzyme A ligase PaaK-like adenylate-forming protein
MNHDRIFSISSFEEFEKISIEVFWFQHSNCSVYRQFCDLLKVNPEKVQQIKDIPFLPIEFFKSKEILAQDNKLPRGKVNEGSTPKFRDQKSQIIKSKKQNEAELRGMRPEKINKPSLVFTSSGTTGNNTSKHLVSDISLYERSFITAFNLFYGIPEDYVILALLPSYLEREGSSLVYMVNHLIENSRHSESGFYLNDLEGLSDTLLSVDSSGKKVLLIGVSFALLDLVEQHKFKLKNTVIMETGGMKGRRREMIREELHAILQKGFSVPVIHSEYGMTELLSQAYSKGNGIFKCPPWMKILIRDPEDALTYLEDKKTGGINVIDLANLYSCSFIATQDLGKKEDDNTTQILGRFDNSDVRGCNLMVL